MEPKTVTMKTEVFGSGRIETTITDLVGECSTWIIETQDASTRDALQALGWISPELAQKILSIIDDGGDLWGSDEHNQLRDIVDRGEYIND